MNILNKLSIRNLKLNKKRSISTIIGIILSVALICAVASMGVSFRETLIENAINETGYYHVRLLDIKENKIENIKNNRDVKDTYQIRKCGYSKLEGSQNESKPYVQLFSMNNNTFENLKFKLVQGRFPNSSNEVIISKSIISDAKVNYNIGDTIKLSVGERKTEDDYELNEKNPYNYEDEKIVNAKEYSFKIVGIIEKPNSNFESYGDPGYTIISTGINEGESDLYLSLKSPKDYEKSVTELLGIQNPKNMGDDCELNRELLRWEAFAFSESTLSMLYSVICVVIVVIVITSVFCIRNSFAIACQEKIKMYSMLASVGTTKKQIKRNVIVEGLILGLIGIPLGILLGVFAVFVLIKIVNMILGEYLLSHVDGLVFKISLIPILLSIVLGLLTIYLSARSSARKASKVSPIEGLRSSNEIKIGSKNLRVPKVISKLFKIGGELAYKNLKRSKKKYRTTVVSISISIFIFITMNAFIVNMFETTGNYYHDYEYNMIIRPSEFDEDINKILSNENVEKYHIVYEPKEHYYKIKDLSKINEIDGMNGYYDIDSGKFVKFDEENYILSIIALDSKSFEEYTNKAGLKYENVKKSGILCDEYVHYDNLSGKDKKDRIYKYSKGDIIEGEYGGKDLQIKIGGISNLKPYGFERVTRDGGYLIVNVDEYKDLGFEISQITIQSNNCSQLEKDLENGNTSLNIYNLEETVKAEKSMVLVIKIFLYGFIAVITLIGVTNIFNTITSNMELRQKEFAMLKSIGMTKKEFNRMINLETIFYGTKSLIYGTVLGLLGTFAMYKAFSVNMEKGIYIPFDAILISAIFVFIFVFVIMKYSIKKINKQNTIETIRNENV